MAKQEPLTPEEIEKNKQEYLKEYDILSKKISCAIISLAVLGLSLLLIYLFKHKYFEI